MILWYNIIEVRSRCAPTIFKGRLLVSIFPTLIN
nr:MAG TPA: hypothetical protein [Caudoviricetes sp.]DAT39493.1 MAG TPA: hypothetical protein [Bacteriophage sp.]